MSDEAPEPVDTAFHQADIAATNAAQAAPEPEPTEVEVEAVEVEVEQNTTEASAPSDGNDPPATPKNKGVGKRIDELTREKYDAIRERDHWREQAQRVAPPQPQPTQAAYEGRPTLEMYGHDYEAYTEALTDFKVNERFRGQEQQRQQAEQQQRVQDQHTRFRQQIDELEREIPGAWAEAVNAPVPTSPVMLEALADSDVGARLGYYLAQHLDEAAAIAGMSPIAAVRAIGRIEAELKAPKAAAPPRPPQSVTKAPAPVSTLRPAAVIRKDLGEMDMDEYTAERNRQRKAAGLIP